MNLRLLRAGLLTCCIVAATACSSMPRERSASAGWAPPLRSYFGQPTPGTTSVLFAPGIVSTDSVELNGVFTPDGREFFFARRVEGVYTMYQAVFEGGVWSVPRPLLLFPGQARAMAVDMAVSPDGGELFFIGRHPHEYKIGEPGYVQQTLELPISRGTRLGNRVCAPAVSFLFKNLVFGTCRDYSRAGSSLSGFSPHQKSPLC